MQRRLPSLAALLIAGAAFHAAPAAAHPHVWVGTKSHFVFENGALTGLRYTWLFDEMYSASAIEGLDKNNDGKLDRTELEELTKVNIEGLKEFDYFTSGKLGDTPVTFGAPKDVSMELIETEEAPGPQLVAGSGQPGVTLEPPPEKPGLWSRFSSWVSGLFSSKPAAPSSSGAQATAQASSGAGQQPAAPDKMKVLALHMTLPLKEPVPPAALSPAGKGFQVLLNDAQMYIWFEPTAKDGAGIAGSAPPECRHTLVEPEMDEEQKKLAEAFGRGSTMSFSMPGKVLRLTCGN